MCLRGLFKKKKKTKRGPVQTAPGKVCHKSATAVWSHVKAAWVGVFLLSRSFRIIILLSSWLQVHLTGRGF